MYDLSGWLCASKGVVDVNAFEKISMYSLLGVAEWCIFVSDE